MIQQDQLDHLPIPCPSTKLSVSFSTVYSISGFAPTLMGPFCIQDQMQG